MLIYDFYRSWADVCRGMQMDGLKNLIMGLIFGSLIWLGLFVLQGFGVYKMAKNRKMTKKWLAFIPIANIFYIGKLVGNCDVFGHKVKRLGLYTMIAQAVGVLLCVAAIGAEFYLYAEGGVPNLIDGTIIPIWPELTGAPAKIAKLYDISGLIVSIIGLIYQIMLFLLYTGLYKKYYPQNHLLLSMLTLFFPIAPYITVFAIRNRKAVDFEAYMRAKREAFFRQQQQYRNMYGNPQNPYGTYTWSPQNPTGNPYERASQDSDKKPQNDEPFSEFSSDKETEDNAEHEKKR